MRLCEIYFVRHKDSFVWKWRPLGEGAARESKETYSLFYECVTAARKNGYQPNQKCL